MVSPPAHGIGPLPYQGARRKSDGEPSRSLSRAVQIAQASANQPPEAGDVCVVTAQDTPIDIPVLAGVSDPDRDPLQILSVSAPASGRVDVEPDGTLAFAPDAARAATLQPIR